MPLLPIKLKPGINSVMTPTLNEGGWSAASNIRFFEGLAQKDGGFITFCNSLNSGVPRALKAWTSLSGISYLAIGGAARLNLFQSGTVYDITPTTVYSLIPISLSVTQGSNTVTITDSVNHPTVGQAIRIRAPVSVGGIVLYGTYLVTGTGAGSYTVTAAVAATSTVSNGGAARQFAVSAGVGPVTVTLPNHGLYTGQIVQVNDPQLVGTVRLQGNYTATVTGANSYTIAPTSNAVSAATLTENGGLLSLAIYGSGSNQYDFNVPQISLDNWGEFLLASPKGGPVFVWQPALGAATPASLVATAPRANNFIFVSAQTQMLVVCGTINPATGLFDPMLVRWSDTGDYTSFTALTTNQAGSFRLTLGSELRAGLAVPNQNLLWTDTALYSMQYIQPPLVWGFQPLGTNCGAVGPHAVGTCQGQIFWMSQNQFMTLQGGTPTIIPCPVWDQVFVNADPANLVDVTCETNSYYGEVGWSVPQTNGTVIAARLKIAGPDAGAWTCSVYHHHTAWIDQSVFGAPLGAHESGYIDQHDVGYDAAGVAAATSLTSGVIMIAEGSETTHVDYVIPDIDWIAPGQLSVTVSFYDYPDKPPRRHGPYVMTPTTQTVRARGRGRGIQFVFSGNDLGSMWRLGNVRYHGQPDGKR